MFQRHYSPRTFQTESSPYFLPPLSCYAPVRCSSRLLLVASCNYQKLHFRQRTTSRTWTITIYFRYLDCASRFISCSPDWKPSLLESNILESNPLNTETWKRQRRRLIPRLFLQVEVRICGFLRNAGRGRTNECRHFPLALFESLQEVYWLQL